MERAFTPRRSATSAGGLGARDERACGRDGLAAAGRVIRLWVGEGDLPNPGLHRGWPRIAPFAGDTFHVDRRHPGVADGD
jgi:hypothetical protein